MEQQRKAFNKFLTLPYIPYNLVVKLMENENIFKILKYNTYDCLSKPELTQKEKIELLWKNQDNQQDYSIFLTKLVENMILDSKTILKIYHYDDVPIDHIKAVACYEFDILYGGKIAMIDYDGVPCNRGDVLQMELLKTLNGAYIGGFITELQYNREMSRNCKAITGVNGNNKFTGTAMVMTGQVSCL